MAPLSTWNDVIFLEWSRQVTDAHSSSPIQYVVLSEITRTDDNGGEEAVDTMFEAMQRTNSGNLGPPVFKHIRTFSYATHSDVEAFHALLGTALGKMVTDFLARHKVELGLRSVTDISVFGTGTPQERYDRQRVRAGLLFKIQAAAFLAGSGSASSETTPELSS